MTASEEKKFQEGYDRPDLWLEEEDEEIDDCDYDLTDGNGCFNPHLKHTNCCFECDLFIDEEEARQKVEEKSGK